MKIRGEGAQVQRFHTPIVTRGCHTKVSGERPFRIAGALFPVGRNGPNTGPYGRLTLIDGVHRESLCVDVESGPKTILRVGMLTSRWLAWLLSGIIRESIEPPSSGFYLLGLGPVQAFPASTHALVRSAVLTGSGLQDTNATVGRDPFVDNGGPRQENT
jgi:hypothetical protein